LLRFSENCFYLLNNEMTFKEFFRLCEFATNLNVPLATVIPGSIPFGAVASDTGPSPSQDPAPIPPRRGELKLGLPEVVKTSAIKHISGPGQQSQGEAEQDGRKNIIQITLEDGTHLMMTWDEFKRIHGEPRVGKMMTVVMQRRPDDTSRFPSQIQSAIVH
jgi:hypothetical protein